MLWQYLAALNCVNKNNASALAISSTYGGMVREYQRNIPYAEHVSDHNNMNVK